MNRFFTIRVLAAVLAAACPAFAADPRAHSRWGACPV